jgi:hypothetical protein
MSDRAARQVRPLARSSTKTQAAALGGRPGIPVKALSSAGLDPASMKNMVSLTKP